MTRSDRPDEAFEQEQMARLYDTVRRELRAGRTPMAFEAAQQLVDNYPNSTTSHELMGDVLAAEGKRAKARAEYKQALELEPANADAERKFAQMALVLGEAQRTRRLLEAGDMKSLRGAVDKDPGKAAIRSMFFPGLGQLYNGEYEKGIVCAALGLPLIGLALWGIAGFMTAALPQSPAPMSTLDTVLALLGLFGYGALATWSIWDAYRSAQASGKSLVDTNMPR